MAKPEINEKDHQFFYRLASLQQAMIYSIPLPVSVWKPEEGGDSIGFPGTPYDQCENKRLGLRTIKRRITTAKNDIKRHLLHHKVIMNQFIEIDNALARQSRVEIGEACGVACAISAGYGAIVNSHLKRFGEDGFLTYPRCPQNIFFEAVDNHGPGPLELKFNSNASQAYFNRDVDSLYNSIESFESRQGHLPYFSLPVDGDITSAGFYDKEYQDKLKKCSTLLEKAGLKIL